MKKHIVAAAFIAISSASAFAADLPARVAAPVAYVPPFSWTGFYLGGELGWIQTKPEYTTGALLLGAPFVVTSGSDKNGLTYGVLGGYNYQVGQLVLGVEGDFVVHFGKIVRPIDASEGVAHVQDNEASLALDFAMAGKVSFAPAGQRLAIEHGLPAVAFVRRGGFGSGLE